MQMGPVEVKRRTLALIKEFVDHMPEAAHNGVIRQMATDFGLLYAGSIFAIESGVSPLTKNHVQKALTRAFRDAVEASKPVDPLAMGLDILKADLVDKIVERKSGSTFGVKDMPAIGRGSVAKRSSSCMRAYFAPGLRMCPSAKWSWARSRRRASRIVGLTDHSLGASSSSIRSPRRIRRSLARDCVSSGRERERSAREASVWRQPGAQRLADPSAIARDPRSTSTT